MSEVIIYANPIVRLTDALSITSVNKDGFVKAAIDVWGKRRKIPVLSNDPNDPLRLFAAEIFQTIKEGKHEDVLVSLCFSLRMHLKNSFSGEDPIETLVTELLAPSKLKVGLIIP